MEKQFIIPGFIVGKAVDPYFTIHREFKQNSKLKVYLNKKFPTEVKNDKKEYTMLRILQLIEQIVNTEKLYDKTNPYIILCDDDLGFALNVHGTLTADTYEYIEKQFKPRRKSSINVKAYRGVESYDHLATLRTPKWASTTATAIQAFKVTLSSTSEHTRFKPKQKLKTFMTEQLKRKPKDTYTIKEIVTEIVQYIKQHEQEMIFKPNPKLILIKDTPLGTALAVNSMDLSQIIHLVRHQLIEEKLPEEIEHIMQSVAETLTAKIRKNRDNNQYVATITVNTTGRGIPNNSYTTNMDIN